jgi:hypothetical protein
LQFPELRLAVAIEDGDYQVDEALADPNTIIDLCASLVVLEQETQGVRPVHYTFQKYMKLLLDIMTNAHPKLASTCLNSDASEVLPRKSSTVEISQWLPFHVPNVLFEAARYFEK